MKKKVNQTIKNCIGMIEFYYKGKKTPCSGSMMYTENTVLIATAAHCIYDWREKRFYDEIYFRPNILKLKRKYRIIQAFVPRIWAESAAIEYDTGFLKIEDAIKNDLECEIISISPIFCQGKAVEFVCGGFCYSPLRRKPIYFSGVSQEDMYFNSSMQGIQ